MENACSAIIDCLNEKVTEKEVSIMNQEMELEKFKAVIDLIEQELKNIENIIYKYG